MRPFFLNKLSLKLLFDKKNCLLVPLNMNNDDNEFYLFKLINLLYTFSQEVLFHNKFMSTMN